MKTYKRYKFLVFFLLLLITACTEDAYVEHFIKLDGTNSILLYSDTTVVIKWKRGNPIFVSKPDSVNVIPNYPYVIALDTIIGIDTLGQNILNIYKRTNVDTKTGEISISNSGSSAPFKIGTYNIYVGLLTSEGFVRYREKPIRMNIVP
ncbi:MAG: hypothetical protein ABFC90_02225 [Bacteroidales bacterium]|nr:hypothetical protein [Bacteroidales bacterium]